MSIASFLKRAVPTAIGLATGGPIGAASAFASTEMSESKRKDIEESINLAQERERSSFMETNFGSTGSSFRDPYGSQLIVNRGTTAPSSGFFGTVRSGLQEVGGLVSDVFSSGIPQLFGVGRPQTVRQQPAVTTVTNVGAQESQGSGSIQAGIGSVLPQVLGGARSLLKSPLGQLALGTGAGTAISMIGPDGKPMRVTRKMRAQLKSLLRMTGNDYALVGNFLNLNQEQMLFILNKTFRNDGPVVTKAALRKTKQTVRRLKSMCDMYDSLRPTARRKTPMRRASSTTLIKN